MCCAWHVARDWVLQALLVGEVKRLCQRNIAWSLDSASIPVFPTGWHLCWQLVLIYFLGDGKRTSGWADDFAKCSPKGKESRWNKNIWRLYGFILVSFRRWSMGPLLVQKPGTGEDYILLYINTCNTTCYLHLILKLCSHNKWKRWHSTFQNELWYQDFSLLWKMLPGYNFVGGFSGLL